MLFVCCSCAELVLRFTRASLLLWFDVEPIFWGGIGDWLVKYGNGVFIFYFLACFNRLFCFYSFSRLKIDRQSSLTRAKFSYFVIYEIKRCYLFVN